MKVYLLQQYDCGYTQTISVCATEFLAKMSLVKQEEEGVLEYDVDTDEWYDVENLVSWSVKEMELIE